MSIWSDVRRLAAERHREVAGETDDLVPAATLLDSAQRATGVTCASRPPGDSLLDGGEACYHRDLKKIYYSRGPAIEMARFYIGHEFGHHWLGEASARCDCADLNMLTPAEPEMSAVGDADAYSPKERREAQANVFAREFLLPLAKLRRRCASGQFAAASVAAELGLPVDLVMHQMADAALLPEERPPEKAEEREHDPDPSQRKAIEAPAGPRQVRAGPGTGKTRTLVGRISHLLDSGEDPGSILALTYSNLSSQDLAARIRRTVGDRATAVWSGTFHAFGLELLRKYGHAIGLSVSPRLLDRTDSLMFLERLLPQLQLHHYLDLHEPARKLKAILGAIGRAKDELCTPAEYEKLAQDMLAAAGSDDEAQVKAKRALEVARAYAVYDQALRVNGCVDFSDLVARAVELLRANPDIRDEVRSVRRHVLVDEYQDMNRASGVFLKEIVTPGKGPWVVGDVRQAIYRFRGASPLNMSRFEEDFTGAQVTDLTTNYRSGGKIVRAFEAFGHTMTAAALAPKGGLEAHRGETTGQVAYDVASTRESEAEGLAKAILERSKNGVPFREQVVLSRWHSTLARLARHLERAGVPCLYFGDFFERPEVRDLLSLLSVVSEPKGTGLLRVAQMPHYAVPVGDIAKVVAWRRDKKLTMLAALRQADTIDGLSDAARDGLRRLVNDTAHWTWPMLPHQFLIGYLFGSGNHAHECLSGDGVSDQQRRLAVYQLLQFAFAFKPPEKVDPKRAFLAHVRRLEILDEEKQLRQLPAAAGDIDAVKLMTIHGSKGLEFPVVYINDLAKGQFPRAPRYDECPPPKGMIPPDPLMSAEAEEDSLFFVGMSRARNTLHMCRSCTTPRSNAANGRVNATPSRFLDPVAGHLSRPVGAAATWTDPGAQPAAHPRLAAPKVTGEWSYRAIETYDDCPRRYYYDHVLALGGSEDEGPYLQFQSALHASLAWLRGVATHAERAAGITARFESDWNAHGPRGHAFEAFYRELADNMVQSAVSVMDGQALPVELTVTLPQTGVVVRCRADHLQSTGSGVRIQRLKASRLSKTEKDKHRYTLWQAAVAQQHGGTVVFEHVSLLTQERRAAPVDPTKLTKALGVVEEVVRKVNAGGFDPDESDRCPTCPYYFICPSAGATV